MPTALHAAEHRRTGNRELAGWRGTADGNAREAGWIVTRHRAIIFALVHDVGEGLWSLASRPGEIEGFGVVAPTGEISIVPFPTRDAEVSDAAIDYAGMDIADCIARLAELGIRVREAASEVRFGPPPT